MRCLLSLVLLFSVSCANSSQAKDASASAKRKPSRWWNRPAAPTAPAQAIGNPRNWTFTTAVKKISRISEFNPVTVYCPCKYTGKKVDLASCGFITQNKTKRSDKIEWEHVAAAESFGQSFKMWREGDPTLCVKSKNQKAYQGRKCAEKDPLFLRMSTDLYNLWPIIGELNAIRSNMTMAQLTGSERNFGGCKVKILDRKFEPMDEYKGMVARIHMYMELAYPGHGVISDKNEKLFQAWDKMYPVSDWECQRADLIEEVQGNANPILKDRCAKR